MKRRTAVIASLCMTAGITAAFVWFIWTRPVRPLDAGEDYSRLSSYLSFSFDQKEKIAVSMEETEDGYLMILENGSDKYWCGKITLTGAGGAAVYQEEFINLAPGGSVRELLGLSRMPEGWKISRSRFYALTYPSPSAKGEVAEDGDSLMGTVWRDVLLDHADMKEENCLEWGEYLYVQDVLAGREFSAVYFYDREYAEYEVKDGVSFPKQESASFAAVVDRDERKLKLVDVRAGMEILGEISLDEIGN